MDNEIEATPGCRSCVPGMVGNWTLFKTGNKSPGVSPENPFTVPASGRISMQWGG